ncbi:DNA adenine methylase [Halostella litorea]|uniref:DNA adenine methylase n=1 Tax=Halostella litorea TaxID=2528831 RepID=UPI0010931455|nr:DNA adenine methylase [Halostella litorea]
MQRNGTGRPDNHVSVFPYPGGKGREVDWILDRMPPHDTFVDVFGGSGAIIYNKPPSKNEVYNDANEDLVQFFRVLREREDDLIDWLRDVPYARSVYEEWVNAFFNGHRPEDPVERAGRFFALRYMQFAGDLSMVNGFKTRAKRSPARTFDNARERVHELADRFRDVIIECRDFERVLRTYDDGSVDVLFYCDPPYPGGEHYYPVEFAHADLADALVGLQSDWMVSYAELPDALVARLIGATRTTGEEFHVVHRDRRHRMCRGTSEATEHLVCNFDPATRAQFLEDGEQTTLLQAETGGNR